VCGVGSSVTGGANLLLCHAVEVCVLHRWPPAAMLPSSMLVCKRCIDLCPALSCSAVMHDI
jgi:hypothetical protein